MCIMANINQYLLHTIKEEKQTEQNEEKDDTNEKTEILSTKLQNEYEKEKNSVDIRLTLLDFEDFDPFVDIDDNFDDNFDDKSLHIIIFVIYLQVLKQMLLKSIKS